MTLFNQSVCSYYLEHFHSLGSSILIGRQSHKIESRESDPEISRTVTYQCSASKRCDFNWIGGISKRNGQHKNDIFKSFQTIISSADIYIMSHVFIVYKLVFTSTIIENLCEISYANCVMIYIYCIMVLLRDHTIYSTFVYDSHPSCNIKHQ